MKRRIKNTLKILIITCLIFALYAFINNRYNKKKIYTKIGEGIFYCVEIARQPDQKSTGGHDGGKYWTGIQFIPGYAYMQTRDKQYGFYMPIYESPCTTDDVEPKKAMILKDPDGKIYYIPQGYDPKDYQYLVSTAHYYPELPEKNINSKSPPNKRRSK